MCDALGIAPRGRAPHLGEHTRLVLEGDLGLPPRRSMRWPPQGWSGERVSHAPEGILSGVRILDFTWKTVGPWAPRLLTHFGAEVIHVERVGSWDDHRYAAPPESDRRWPAEGVHVGAGDGAAARRRPRGRQEALLQHPILHDPAPRQAGHQPEHASPQRGSRWPSGSSASRMRSSRTSVAKCFRAGGSPGSASTRSTRASCT